MIRTSQSLLANCISNIKLGRDWRRPTDGSVDLKETEILLSFLDTPNATFSLHNFVKHGEAACGKMPGEWFGPSAAASSIKELQSAYSQDLQVYVSSGSDIYENQFLHTAVIDGNFKPTLILLGLRLGIDTVNKVYWDGIKQLLACPQSAGIAGGRPSSSHYFFGYQGDYLFYLDPHYPRPSFAAEVPTDFTIDNVNSFHTNKIRRLHLNEMDPSMLVGILVRDREDWVNWKESVAQSPVKRIVQISKEPFEPKRSSVSVGSDDEEEGFIDVLLEPENQEEPSVIASELETSKITHNVSSENTQQRILAGVRVEDGIVSKNHEILEKEPSASNDIETFQDTKHNDAPILQSSELADKREHSLSGSTTEVGKDTQISNATDSMSESETTAAKLGLIDPIDAAVEKLKNLELAHDSDN